MISKGLVCFFEMIYVGLIFCFPIYTHWNMNNKNIWYFDIYNSLNFFISFREILMFVDDVLRINTKEKKCVIMLMLNCATDMKPKVHASPIRYMDIVLKLCFCILKWTRTSTTPSCSRPIPAQKSRGNSVLGAVFSHTMPKMDFRYSHRFSWEKIH